MEAPLIEVGTQPPKVRGAGVLSSVANIANSVLGAGILALPFAYARAGVWGGTVLVCWSAALNVFTMHLLSATTRRVEDASFRTIASLVMPKKLHWVFDGIVVVLMLGLSASYLMIFGNLVSQCVRELEVPKIVQNRVFWVLVGLALVAPPSFAKSLDALKFTSSIAMVLMGYVAAVVVAYRAAPGACDDSPHCGGTVRNLKLNLATLEALSLTTFAYTAQTQLVSVANELDAYTQRKMDAVIASSISLCCALYCVVGQLGYETFGNVVLSNVLESYRPTPPVSAARIAISFVVAFSYPLMAQPCRISLVTLLRASPNACTLGILAFSATVAATVDDLGAVLSVIGATASTAIAYVIPAYAYIRLFTGAAPRWKLLAAKFVFLYGIATVPLCLYSTAINHP
ncbi:hypothetical protein CTAYLR_004011 [Chrysophaeum taylorii]|uniref:Amino acid transporter transmembrane domain-containing protein n=1 Tax=Chrysophaeum taylorii TaxID=2483200 RepID=A0AAD7XIN3_9STRA|nr:hypothetical protein CTAYLR_004011 [Chrysophaeum taylorii]